MRPRPALALSALFLAAVPACGPAAEPQPNAVEEAKITVQTNGVAAEKAAAPAPTPAACATPQQVELDAASFESSDVPAFPQERLEAFRRSAAAAFGAAVEAACAAGELDPARLASIRRLLIQSASGATETAFYEDEESVGAGTLVFQFIFVEADLAVPDHADIREGLSCWANPERPVCAEREP